MGTDRMRKRDTGRSRRIVPTEVATVLVVDDSVESCDLLEAMLRQGGYHVEVARSAEEALVYLGAGGRTRAMQIDLVIMDITLPRLDGLTAIRRIRGVDHLRDLPIVVVSAHTEASALQEAFAVGARDYVTKPVRRAELLTRVGAALQRGSEPDDEAAYARALLDLTHRLEEANAALHRHTFIDLLTDVPNRTYFDERIDMERRRALRDKTELSLVLVDMDFLHDFNERLGHAAGDTALKQVAAALRDTLRRPADFLARLGGGEFAALLPATSEIAARTVAERLRAAVEMRGIAHPASAIASVCTATAGMATAPVGGGMGLHALVESAQRALQLGKQLGRNRVCASAPLGGGRPGAAGIAARS